MLKIRIVFQKEDTGIGHVISMQEFPQGGARAPDAHLGKSLSLGLMETADHGRDHMAVFRVIIVTCAVEVRRHGADGVKAVLLAVGLAHLDARDLGQGIGIIGGLQGSGEQVLLFDGLRAELGIDAGRPQKEEFFYAILPGTMDDVVLDLEVLIDELGRIGGIGVDTAHLGSSQNDVVRFFSRKKVAYGLLLSKIKFRMAANAQIFIPRTAQGPADGAAHQTTMPGHKEFTVFLQHDVLDTARGGHTVACRP